MVRRYRKDTYRIRVENPDRVETGVKKVLVDDKEHPVDKPVFINDGKEHDVLVIMG